MKNINTEEFDKLFDNGKSIIDYLDTSKAEHPNLKSRRVNIDFPSWMVQKIDEKARILGLSRQALIKMWIAEKLKSETV